MERRILDPGDRERRRREILPGRVHRLLELGGDLHGARLEMEGHGHVDHSRAFSSQLSAFSKSLQSRAVRGDDLARLLAEG